MKKPIFFTLLFFLLLSNKVESQNNNAHFYVNSIQELRNFNDPLVGDVVVTKSYYGDNKGGGTTFIKVQDMGQLDNGGTIIRTANNSVYEAIEDSEINIKQFGAKGDYISNQNAMLNAYKLQIPIRIEPGIFELNDLVLDEPVDKLKLLADGVEFKYSDDLGQARNSNYMLFIQNVNKITLEGEITFNGNEINNPNQNNQKRLVEIRAKATGTVLGDNSSGTFFKADKINIINAADSGLRIKGLYNVNGTGETFFENIEIGSIYIFNYRASGVQIQSINSHIKINEVIVKQTDRCLNYSGGGSKAFAISTEANNFNNGTTFKLGYFRADNAKANCLFLQNIKDFSIDNIIFRDALYNEDGTDSYVSSYGVTFVKFDYALSPEDQDFRKGYVNNFTFINSNPSLSLLQPDGNSPGGKFRIAFWADEGFNNGYFNNSIFDLPVKIGGSSEYFPPLSGNHIFNNLKLTGKFQRAVSYLTNSRFNYLNLDNTIVTVNYSIIENLVSRNSLININKIGLARKGNSANNSKLVWKKTNHHYIEIHNSRFDENSLFNISFPESSQKIENKIGSSSFLKFYLNNHRGGYYRIFTNSSTGLFNIDNIKNRLELSFNNVEIKAHNIPAFQYFKETSNSLLTSPNLIAGTIDLTDTSLYPPFDPNIQPSDGLKDLPEGVTINASRLINSRILPYNTEYRNIPLNLVSKRKPEQIQITTEGYTYVNLGTLDYNSFDHRLTVNNEIGKTLIGISRNTAKAGDIVIIKNSGSIRHMYNVYNNIQFVNLSGNHYLNETGVLRYYKIIGNQAVEYSVP